MQGGVLRTGTTGPVADLFIASAALVRVCPGDANRRRDPRYHRSYSRVKAAEIAGLSRADFLEALFRAKVPACPITVEELNEELET